MTKLSLIRRFLSVFEGRRLHPRRNPAPRLEALEDRVVPASVNDGLGTDVDFQRSPSVLSANWSAFDAPPGVIGYQWRIGTTPGGGDVLSLTSSGIASGGAGLSATLAGLALPDGTTYFITVRGNDGVGGFSEATSDGVTVETNDVVQVGPTTADLISAITNANKTTGSTTLNLTASTTYTLTAVDNYWYGANGLPAIANEIIIQGNGSVIQRSGDTLFRFFYISDPQYGGLARGTLTLENLTLLNGFALGGSSYYGGGGLGAGGAIFNHGSVTLNGVLLTGNTAQGGSSGEYMGSNPHFGAGIGQNAQDSSGEPGGFGGSIPWGQYPNGASTTTYEGQGGSASQAAGFGGGGAKYSDVGNGGSTLGGFGGGGGNNYGHGGFGGGNGGYQYWAEGYGGGGAALGGAIFNRGGDLIITNSTISGNLARGGEAPGYYSSTGGDALGGGIFNLNGAVALINDTIAGNDLKAYTYSAGYYYALTDGYQVYNLGYNFGGPAVQATLTIANTILDGAGSASYSPNAKHDLVNQLLTVGAGDTASVINAPRVTTVSNIISTDVSNQGGTISATYKVADPMLISMNDNGGYSHTIALQPGSPARNAGSLEAVNQDSLYDQRGPLFRRVQEGYVDIGAIQMQHVTPLDRLAIYTPTSPGATTGNFLPITAGSIGQANSQPGAKNNVYVISHGWMAGYQSWVEGMFNQGRVPLSWDTWPNPNPPVITPYYGASTPWLVHGNMTDGFESRKYSLPSFTVNPYNLAASILLADPTATVLGFSWIDESATPTEALLPKHGWESEARTTMAGVQMAEGLMQALDANYANGRGRVHLMGHSHGARVASVAALTLQKAAGVDAKYDVLGQLTLFDSPENNTSAASNPVYYQDTANFDWFILAQLNIASANSRFDQNPNPALVTPVFVDSYVSYFGSPFNNFMVNSPDQGIHNVSLGNVIDVTLEPTQWPGIYEWFGQQFTPYGLFHEYSANWYAGSGASLTSGTPVGMAWSPLISTNEPLPQSAQNWNMLNMGPLTQYVLTEVSRPNTMTPKFSTAPVTYVSSTPGVTAVGNWTGVNLNDAGGTATFNGTIHRTDDSLVGFSFDFNFQSGSDNAELQIFIGDELHFAMNVADARSASLPELGRFSTTFTLGYQYTGTLDFQINLVVPNDNTTGAATTVLVDNFHFFTLDGGSSGAIPLHEYQDIYHRHTVPVPTPNDSQDQAYVVGLYHALLNRDADDAGLAGWTSALAAGASRQSVVLGIRNSLEHRGLEVDAFYQRFLRRPADEAGRAMWVSLLISGMPEAEVVQGFISSAEYQARYSSNAAYVESLFENLLDRSGELGGVAGWKGALDAGTLTRNQAAAGFLGSEESHRLAVDSYYAAFYHRAADEAGAAFWLAQLRSGKFTYGTMAEAFLYLPEFYANALTP